jgi:hypothetical protein
MNAFKKIEADPVLEKRIEIYQNNPEIFKNLTTLYWPIAEYGNDLSFNPPESEYIIWPASYYNSASLLMQNIETTKYYVDFYEGINIPFDDAPFPTYSEGDLALSFIINDVDNPSVDYNLYFVPTEKRLFSVSWAHYAGSGGFDSSFNKTYTYPTKAIYNQAKMLFNDTKGEKFKINGVNTDHFFLISLDQKNITGSIEPNSLVLPLMKVPALASPEGETHEQTYTFTDYNQELLYSNSYGYYSNIVSGNLSEVSSSEVFGAVYYDYNTIILNSEKIENTILKPPSSPSFLYTGSSPGPYTNFFLTSSQSSNGYIFGRILRNAQYFSPAPYPSIISNINPLSETQFQFKLKNESYDSIYFLHINQNEFNYTNNPTCFEKTGFEVKTNTYGNVFKFESFKNNPVAYITSIGLYNDGGDLLAVAKLNNPLKKDFNTAYLFKIRIRF